MYEFNRLWSLFLGEMSHHELLDDVSIYHSNYVQLDHTWTYLTQSKSDLSPVMIPHIMCAAVDVKSHLWVVMLKGFLVNLKLLRIIVRL